MTWPCHAWKLGTPLLLWLAVSPPASGMDVSRLREMSNHIEDRRGQKKPRIRNLATPLSPGAEEERNRLVEARNTLIGLGKQARLFAFPFSCPVLKDFRSRFASLGGEVGGTPYPSRIALSPPESEAAALNSILNPASGKRADACTKGADSAVVVSRELRRSALEGEMFVASYSRAGMHAESLFFALALADDAVQKDRGRKLVTDIVERIVPDCAQALGDASGALSQFADAYFKLGRYFRNGAEDLQSCLKRISGEEPRDEIVPPPLEDGEGGEKPAP